jgi:hypothetical protein
LQEFPIIIGDEKRGERKELERRLKREEKVGEIGKMREKYLKRNLDIGKWRWKVFKMRFLVWTKENKCYHYAYI